MLAVTSWNRPTLIFNYCTYPEICATRLHLKLVQYGTFHEAITGDV